MTANSFFVKGRWNRNVKPGIGVGSGEVKLEEVCHDRQTLIFTMANGTPKWKTRNWRLGLVKRSSEKYTMTANPLFVKEK